MVNMNNRFKFLIQDVLISAIETSKQQFYFQISKNWWILLEALMIIGHIWKRF